MMREDDDGGDMERAFDEMAVPPWWKQITIRAIATSFVLSILFNVIVCKLNLTTGIIPSLNVAAGLLGFAVIKTWTVLLEKCGYLKQPFTRQENTVIQTCIIASSGIAFSSGTGSYLLGMSPLIASQAETGNTPLNVKKLSLGWIIAFLYLVSFVGLFAIVPLRRMMILRYKLTYPSGTATAYLINSFHTPKGAKIAKKQVWTLFKSFAGSFLWACFQWFFTAADGCGFSSMPTFGRTAFKKRFYFDFSGTYVGVGMICPYMINISLLIGAIISWALMWPAIESKEGDWYEAGLPGNSLHGIQGYRVFIAVATILGDGVFHVLYMLCHTLWAFRGTKQQPNPLAKTGEGEGEGEGGYDEMRRKEYFLKDQIPIIVAIGGYIVLALLSTFLVPQIFHQLKWYYIIVVYVFAPVFAFCNSYGAGLTDWSLASNYSKISILVVSALVGLDHGGVIAGLASCGVMMSIVATASDLMQDFRTGYLTLSSPRAMFASQVLGTAMGCTISPLVFWFFYKAYSVGDPDGAYPAPYSGLYRGMALLGVEGLSALPKNCWKLALICFCAAILINGVILLLKTVEEKRNLSLKAVENNEKKQRKTCFYKFIPKPMCMAIPFYLGGYFAIDMCVGSLILLVWQFFKKKQAKEMGPAVASGLICGDSLWGIPAAVLSLLGAKPPVCMKFW